MRHLTLLYTPIMGSSQSPNRDLPTSSRLSVATRHRFDRSSAHIHTDTITAELAYSGTTAGGQVLGNVRSTVRRCPQRDLDRVAVIALPDHERVGHISLMPTSRNASGARGLEGESLCGGRPYSGDPLQGVW
jgi:hypothetical protein